MKENLKFSRFVHFFSSQQTLAIYHAVQIKIFFIESENRSSVFDHQSLLQQFDDQTIG